MDAFLHKICCLEAVTIGLLNCISYSLCIPAINQTCILGKLNNSGILLSNMIIGLLHMQDVK